MELRSLQAYDPCEFSGENPFLPLLSFRCLPVILGFPWLADTSLQSLPLSSCGVLPCLCLGILSSSYKEIGHIGLRLTLIQYDLLST